MWHQYQIVLLLDGIQLETYLQPHRVHPRLLQPPSGSPFHSCRAGHSLLVLAVVLLILLSCWKLAIAELLSLGNDSPSGLVPYNGNIHDLLLALALSGWLLGQEGEVPGCSIAGIGFLPIGCFDGIAATAQGTASGTAVGAGAGDLEGDSA
jgi:hypothetical protein